jgi:hypothetical protein
LSFFAFFFTATCEEWLWLILQQPFPIDKPARSIRMAKDHIAPHQSTAYLLGSLLSATSTAKAVRLENARQANRANRDKTVD